MIRKTKDGLPVNKLACAFCRKQKPLYSVGFDGEDTTYCKSCLIKREDYKK